MLNQKYVSLEDRFVFKIKIEILHYFDYDGQYKKISKKRVSKWCPHC